MFKDFAIYNSANPDPVESYVRNSTELLVSGGVGSAWTRPYAVYVPSRNTRYLGVGMTVESPTTAVAGSEYLNSQYFDKWMLERAPVGRNSPLTAFSKAREVQVVVKPDLINLYPYPSFEAVGGPVVVETNLATNPSMETAGATVEVARNFFTNPSMETAGATVEVARNLVTNPSLEVDTAGWAAGSNTAIARNTTEFDVGVASLSLTAAAAGDVYASHAGIPVVASTAYATRIRVKSGVSRSVRLQINWYDSADATLRSDAGVLVTTSTTGWTEITNIQTSPAGAVKATIYPYVVGAAAAEVHYVDAAMFVAGSVLLPYFDGATAAAGDYTYAWTGTAHASASTKSAPSVTEWNGGYGGSTPTRSTTKAYIGAASLAVTAASAAEGNATYRALSSTSVPVTPGKTYTAQARVTQGSASRSCAVELVWYDSAGVGVPGTLSSALVDSDSTWKTVTVTGVAPTGAATVRLNLTANRGVGGVIPTGEITYFDAVLLAEGGSTTYFDGDTPAAGDYTYAWTGTAHASASVKRAPVVVGYGSGNANPVYRTSWASRGIASMEIWSLGNSNDSYVDVGGDVGAVRLGMVAGKTYTASAKFNTPAALSGVLSDRARGITVHTKVGADPYVITKSPSAPVTGVGRVSVTFTVPTGATEAFIRIYNGSAVFGESVFVDEFSLTETNVDSGYFDGSTPADSDFTYAWTGVAHASTSTRSGNVASGVQVGQVIAVSSTDWVGSGIRSMRAYSKYSGPPSIYSTYIEMGDSVEWGKTYTISVTVRIREPLLNAPMISAFTLGNTPNIDKRVYTPSSQPGVYRISSTFTLPALNGGNKYLRLNLNNDAGTSVWFDDVIITEGSEVVDYFDGSGNDDTTWEEGGVAHQSRSYYYENRLDRTEAVIRAIRDAVPLGIGVGAPRFGVWTG